MVILINNYILICFQFYFYFFVYFVYLRLFYYLSILKKIDYKFSLKINDIIYHTNLKHAKENE